MHFGAGTSEPIRMSSDGIFLGWRNVPGNWSFASAFRWSGNRRPSRHLGALDDDRTSPAWLPTVEAPPQIELAASGGSPETRSQLEERRSSGNLGLSTVARDRR